MTCQPSFANEEHDGVLPGRQVGYQLVQIGAVTLDLQLHSDLAGLVGDRLRDRVGAVEIDRQGGERNETSRASVPCGAIWAVGVMVPPIALAIAVRSSVQFSACRTFLWPSVGGQPTRRGP